MRKIHLQMDGNQVVATWDDFDCLAVSPAGFGDNIGEAVCALINETASYALNGIVSSIENAAHLTNSSRIIEARGEDRASKSEESPGTVPGVPAANTASPKLPPFEDVEKRINDLFIPCSKEAKGAIINGARICYEYIWRSLRA
jgi:hypothetical protein